MNITHRYLHASQFKQSSNESKAVGSDWTKSVRPSAQSRCLCCGHVILGVRGQLLELICVNRKEAGLSPTTAIREVLSLLGVHSALP